jgi:predicted CXXCH cytochrome family protein
VKLRVRLLIAFAVVAAATGGFGYWSFDETQKSKTYVADFVGRGSCVDCHAEQTRRFTGSHHDKAMDPATPETVVDPKAFDNQEFTYFGVTSKFTRRGDKFYVTTDDADGQIKEFEIKYVFGVDPLQQYMVEFPDTKKVRTPQGDEIELPAGRVQVLSLAWDTHGKRWFHLYAKQEIKAGDWLHWTGGGQNWNYMCADCHSTNLQKKFDQATNAYHTTFSEMDVSCEACHGPGSEHVARAKSALGFNDPRHFHSYALAGLKGADPIPQIESCAPCHSRRRIVHADYRAGKPLFDFYEPEKLDGELYFADGQIKEELYEYGSFLQSRMFRENVRCSNCHDPHSLKLKFEGNALCTQCHVQAKYDSPTHHHHQIDSTGSKCVECHMPERTYMEVDPRRDHSIRVPRPDLTKSLGVPNACAQCHDKLGKEKPMNHLTVDEQIDKIVEWYGPKRAQTPHYGETLDAGRKFHPHAVEPLIELAKKRPTATADERARAVGPNVRASAVALLANYLGQVGVRDALSQALNDDEPAVRSAAVRAIDVGDDTFLRTFSGELVSRLSDPSRTVRTEAARVLCRIYPDKKSRTEDRDTFERVFKEWVEGQNETADQAGTHTALGTAYANRLKSADFDDPQAVHEALQKWSNLARSEYLKALKLEPLHLPTMRNYAALLDMIEMNEAAETVLKHALATVPKIDEPEEAKRRFTAETNYELGYLLFRDPAGKRMSDAAGHLKLSVEGDPTNLQSWLLYGVSLVRLGNLAEGEKALREFCKRMPQGSAEAIFPHLQAAIDGGNVAAARLMVNVILETDSAAAIRIPGLLQLQQSLGREK